MAATLAGASGKVIIGLKEKGIFIMLFAIVVVAIMVGFYIMDASANKIGGALINGVQGRYFIPVCPLLLLFFANKRLAKFADLNNTFKIMAPLFVLTSSFITIYTIINRFYYL
jgi:uncharacterized membrane protein